MSDLVIRKGTVTWTLSFAVLILGLLAYHDLPQQLEPELSVREALVVTPYPGASANEVEQEVSEKIEWAARELDELRRVESYSTRGRSVVKAFMRDDLDGQGLGRVRDDLRRKIDSVESKLPPGAGPSVVADDFGDIYGAYYALVGAGFTQTELMRVAELVRRELGSLAGVRKTILFGEQQETIFVEIAKANALGIGVDRVLDALRTKNQAADAGRIRIGPEYVPIYPSRLYRSEQDLGELLIAGESDRLARLGDVAEIRRGYEDPPRRLLRVDGAPAIGIAVSASPGMGLVAVGEAVARKLAQLEPRIPLGMELKPIGLQPQAVAAAIDSFLASFVLAFALVIAVQIFFMGLRSGLIVAFATLLSLAATFPVLDFFNVGLNRISLGGLIIALGPLTTNALVVVDAMKVRMDQGMAGLQAAREVASRNAVLLFGTTAIVVLAFASAGHMDNSIGEYTHDLHLVLPTALAISWVTAFTTAPLFASRFLKSGAPGSEKKDPNVSRWQRLYAQQLAAAIRRRRAVLGTVTLLLGLSLYGYGFVKQIYFPATDTPAFLVEVYFRAGTHIRETERRMGEIQAYLRGHEGISSIATAIGDGHPRHLPIYDAGPDLGSHYAVSLVHVDDSRRIDDVRLRMQTDLEQRFPDAVVNVKKYVQASETPGGRVQVRISGPDPAELRRLADRTKVVIGADPDAIAVRDEWGAKVKVAHPVLGQDRARRLRIDRKRIADALRTSYSGTLTGYYREGVELIPIVARVPLEERDEVEDMADILVTSPLRGNQVPMPQIVDRLETLTEDPRRSRRDGRPTITVHAEANRGPSLELLKRIKPRVEKALHLDTATHAGQLPQPRFDVDFDTVSIDRNDMVPIKGRPGYFIGWGGEAADYEEANANLATSIPVNFGIAVLVTIALFNALRQPLIVLLTAPLSIIGVTAGLLLTGQPFGFMSLLGVVGVSGMAMKNAVLMVDRIDWEMARSNAHPTAILCGASSSLRPVVLSAGTSVLAVLPLLRDDFFRSMAVSIATGLAIATILSLVLVPVLYTVLFRVGDDGA